MKLVSGPPVEHMPGNKYNSRNPTVVDRLLREREQRKSNRSFQQHDAGNSHGGGGDDYDGGGCGREPGVSEREPKGAREVNCECGTIPNGEAGLTAGKMSGNGCKRSNGKAMKQRLLVVANRLPVSAVRHGEDSWVLEISAGGLVSALLGKRLPLKVEFVLVDVFLLIIASHKNILCVGWSM